MNEQKPENFSHFNGKDALRHVAEAQMKGIFASSEIHGAETPGSYFAAFDAARQAAFILMLLSLLFNFFEFTREQIFCFLVAFSLGFVFWMTGRSGWLAWARLERLHRVVDEEQKEIQEHRPQEREELKALYKAKGFEGALLDEVVDVLMADGDRLLRVMLQEEMGFRLEENEHPLVQGLGAAIGTIIATLVTITSFYFFDHFGLIFSALFILSLSAGFSAYREKNRVVHALIWNVGIAIFAYATSYYIMQFLIS